MNADSRSQSPHSPQPAGRLRRARAALTAMLPEDMLYRARKARAFLASRGARAAFERSTDGGAWLDPAALERMAGRGAFTSDYGWDAEARLKRGVRRARRMLRISNGRLRREVAACLEVGCAGGMTSRAMRRAGARAVAVDITPDAADPRAVRAGVEFHCMEAERLRFPDESFDLVFSFNSFEHFRRPDVALDEATRVVRRGGHVHLDFGPLWAAPRGLHAWRQVAIPYCQHLFERATLEAYARGRGSDVVPFDTLNGWTATRYRKLWRSRERALAILHYRKRFDLSGLALVKRHPSCFKGKVDGFDDLIVSSIEVLFRRIA